MEKAGVYCFKLFSYSVEVHEIGPLLKHNCDDHNYMQGFNNNIANTLELYEDINRCE